jgi:hypothetical protein
MNLQIELRKMIDWINSQPIIIAVLLWFFVVVFVIIPFAIPAMIIYLIWTAIKSREKVQ